MRLYRMASFVGVRSFPYPSPFHYDNHVAVVDADKGEKIKYKEIFYNCDRIL